eukprot:scaffold268812_cov43-Tisochrysis_lutea.AAC.1
MGHEPYLRVILCVPRVHCNRLEVKRNAQVASGHNVPDMIGGVGGRLADGKGGYGWEQRGREGRICALRKAYCKMGRMPELEWPCGASTSAVDELLGR